MKFHTCKICKVEQNENSFYKSTSGKPRVVCKSCVLIRNRELYHENPDYKIKRKIRNEKYKQKEDYVEKAAERSAKHYKSLKGRAMTLFKSGLRRSSNFNEIVDYDYLYILDKLKLGVCEVTGIPFDFDKPKTTCKNPFSPSIDRINPNLGYCKSNVRIVIWQFNLMKGEMTDADLFKLCRRILNVSDKEP